MKNTHQEEGLREQFRKWFRRDVVMNDLALDQITNWWLSKVDFILFMNHKALKEEIEGLKGNRFDNTTSPKSIDYSYDEAIDDVLKLLDSHT